jgi:hypothetical protein
MQRHAQRATWQVPTGVDSMKNACLSPVVIASFAWQIRIFLLTLKQGQMKSIEQLITSGYAENARKRTT